MEYVLTPRSEIECRIKTLQSQMGEMDGALLFHAVDICYFTGTAQDGLAYIPREGEPVVMMKRSLERAKAESPLEVLPLKNMRNLKSDLGIPAKATVGLEMDVLPCSFYFKVNKALEDARFVDVAERIKHIRSVKSDFEAGPDKRGSPHPGSRLLLRPGLSGRRHERGGPDLPDRVGDALPGASGLPALSPVQQHRPVRPCHVRGAGSFPQLSRLAQRGPGHLADLSPGGRLCQDKEK